MDSILSPDEEEKDISLLDTIKVPRNLGLITERLPKPNYNSNPVIKRNGSVGSRLS